jgi:hypothetical protein
VSENKDEPAGRAQTPIRRWSLVGWFLLVACCRPAVADPDRPGQAANSGNIAALILANTTNNNNSKPKSRRGCSRLHLQLVFTADLLLSRSNSETFRLPFHCIQKRKQNRHHAAETSEEGDDRAHQCHLWAPTGKLQKDSCIFTSERKNEYHFQNQHFCSHLSLVSIRSEKDTSPHLAV